VIAALLSRSKVFVLKPLDEAAIVTILRKAMTDVEHGLGRQNPEAGDDALGAIARFANGDARSALNLLQLTVSSAQQPAGRPKIDQALLEKVLTNKALLYDKSGEEHYNLMSALHKSMRNSDADASIYWLARMLEAGEDPKYVARRLIRFASEDIGNADPQALAITVAAKDAVHFIGMPEGNTALAQAVLYLATAPKSNAVYTAYSDAADAAKTDFAAPVPLHIRNAPTKLMKQLDYGKGYKYAHNEPDAIANMDCLPDNLKGREFYKPTDFGFEKEITKRLAWWKSRRNKSDG
jgi:putative ATPase